MQFVADESCAGPVIRALRAAGHDVIAIAESAKGAADEAVMERAFSEERVLITEDNDFGELVYARGQPSVGVIFVKFHSRARGGRGSRKAGRTSAQRLRGGGTRTRARGEKTQQLTGRMGAQAAMARRSS